MHELRDKKYIPGSGLKYCMKDLEALTCHV